ncbi:MAG: phytase [Cyclobacteriaceae bacterium]|nr:phytase [Cyclobacteriaceae bacterium]
MKYLNYTLIPVILFVIQFSCQQKTNGDNSLRTERNMEAREDSTKLATAYESQSKIPHTVVPLIQTDPVQEDANEDAADDPAIWYNNPMPDQSLVFGTNKKSGVHAYGLDGGNREFYAFGKINNIDIRQQVKVTGHPLDILGGSNRTDNSIIIHGIDSIGNLYDLMDGNFLIDTADIDEVYGFCMYKDTDGNGYAIVNGKNGKINQYLIVADGNAVTLQLVKSWQLDSQPEGMVADDQLGHLYIGEEEQGIWKLSLSDEDSQVVLLQDAQKENNPSIEYDIEGLSIYYDAGSSGFLLASIQGSFSYAVFDRQHNHYLGSFKIGEGRGIDGVEETDGLDIYSSAIGEQFPNGLLVVQDGFNYNDSIMVGQNFKYVALDEIISLVGLMRKQTLQN